MIRTKSTKLRIPLPEGWHQVNFEKGLKINTETLTSAEIISILSDVPLDTLKNSTDLETLHYLRTSLLFLNDSPIQGEPEMPKQVWNYKLPYLNYSDKFDLGKATVGQVEDMQAELQKIEEDNPMAIYPKICAIYLDPIVNGGEYNYDRVEALAKRVYTDLDFKTVLNMGSFFLMRLIGLSTGSTINPSKVSRMRQRLKLALMSLVQRLVSILP